MKLKPIVTHVNGYDIHLRSLIIADNFNKVIEWEDPRRDYSVYVWRHKQTGIIYYIGKGVFINGKWHLCRIILHRDDLLANTINPEEWIGEVWFEGLSENQAFAAEAYLISICNRKRSRRGLRVWDGSSLINKRREKKHERLIKKYLKLDGNNDWETLRREIYDY